MQLRVCDTKTLYDTEFEAEVAAAKVGHRRDEEFEHYQCGRHWHICHTDPTKRRGAGKKHWRCPSCKNIYRKKTAEKHKCDINK